MPRIPSRCARCCRMRALFERVAALELPRVEMRTLSMGMSGDFEVAIEEGPTWCGLGRRYLVDEATPK